MKLKGLPSYVGCICLDAGESWLVSLHLLNVLNNPHRSVVGNTINWILVHRLNHLRKLIIQENQETNNREIRKLINNQLSMGSTIEE